MLEYLEIKNIGPAPKFELEFGKRLNILTGDNGLGKSFLLDIIWWSLTRRWPSEVNPRMPTGLPALPLSKDKASITFRFTTNTGTTEAYTSKFDREEQCWKGRPGRPANPGLVLYAQVDGSFALWDPARNYWKKKGQIDVQDRPPAYVFTPFEIWNGLSVPSGISYCEGLIRDWASWQKEGGETFELLKNVLATLSPPEEKKIEPGKLTRISLEDARDIPTLKMPYGQSVPILHVSAALRRIIAISYLLVWTWEEHNKASELLDQKPTRQIIFLIDEIEAHLHPKWQRQIIASIIGVMESLVAKSSIQLITATHSPLVMASLETIFDPKQDAWFDIDYIRSSKTAQSEGKVILEKRELLRHGEASNWLTSEAFDLESSRSVEAEELLKEVSGMLKNPDSITPQQAKKTHKKLKNLLSEEDPAWFRWRYVAEKKGWLQ